MYEYITIITILWTLDDLLRQLHQSQAKAESLLAFDEAAAFEDAKIRKLRLQVRLSDHLMGII